MVGQSENSLLNILLLCDFNHNCAGTIIDHVNSFKKYSKHNYVIRNALGDSLSGVDLNKFDVIIVHYSLVACYDNFIAPATRRRIRAFDGFKAAFVQDDYRFIDRTVEAFAYMRIHALFPLVGPDILDDIYPPEKLPGVKRVTVLAGYVPEDLIGQIVPSYESRPVDVGYRARKLPAWMGSHTLQKWQIADKFVLDAQRHDLVTDISYLEEDRIYGDAWIKFVTSCKTMLGTESGANVCDFTGKIQKDVENHVARDPGISFDELRDLYFRDEDSRLMMNVISPRCFEAAALKTLMILYEGEYSGVLTPWKHYVPLKKDHSNMAEIIDVLRTPERAGQIIERAYEDLVTSGCYSYSSMVKLVEETISENIRPEMLAANRKQGAMGLRVRKRLQLLLLKKSGLVAGRTDLELSRIETLGSFFSRNSDAELHLYIEPGAGIFELVAVPSGSDSLADKALMLDEQALEKLLVSTEINYMRWLNCDPLGLGCQSPFEREFAFFKLPFSNQFSSSLICRLLGHGKTRFKWYKKAFVVDSPISPIEAHAMPIAVSEDMVYSPAEFYPGHTPIMAFNGSDESYVAAVEGQESIQGISVRLGDNWRVKRIAITWESSVNLAREFTVSLLHDKSEVFSHVVRDNDAVHYEIDVPDQDVSIHDLHLTVHQFKGQERLLLRQINLWGIPEQLCLNQLVSLS